MPTPAIEKQFFKLCTGIFLVEYEKSARVRILKIVIYYYEMFST